MKSRVDRTLGKGLRTQILRQTSVTSRHLTAVICFLAARHFYACPGTPCQLGTG